MKQSGLWLRYKSSKIFLFVMSRAKFPICGVKGRVSFSLNCAWSCYRCQLKHICIKPVSSCHLKIFLFLPSVWFHLVHIYSTVKCEVETSWTSIKKNHVNNVNSFEIRCNKVIGQRFFFSLSIIILSHIGFCAIWANLTQLAYLFDNLTSNIYYHLFICICFFHYLAMR